jgi:hypothetical protein
MSKEPGDLKNLQGLKLRGFVFSRTGGAAQRQQFSKGFPLIKVPGPGTTAFFHSNHFRGIC